MIMLEHPGSPARLAKSPASSCARLYSRCVAMHGIAELPVVGDSCQNPSPADEMPKFAHVAGLKR
jgi:hypothetical protein